MSKTRLWSGRVLSGIVVLFFLMDGGMKLARAPVSVQFTTQLLGYPNWAVAAIGATLLVCTVIYVIPRTSALGAVLLTAYLGGAVASNVRIGSPLFNTFFPIIFAVFMWAGLWLRDRRIEQLLPITRNATVL